MITTRYGISTDIEPFLELAKEGVKEIRFAERIDADVLRHSLNLFIEAPTFFFRVAEYEGKIAGAFCAMVVPAWFNDSAISDGVVVFVAPNFRGRGITQRLYKDYITWAKRFDNISVIRLATSAGSHLDLTKLITRLGFEKTGSTYAMRGNYYE